MYKNLNLCTTTTSEGGRRDCRVVRVNIKFLFSSFFWLFFLKRDKKMMMEFLPCRMISACSAALGCWASAAWNRKEWHLRAVWQLRNLFELVGFFFPPAKWNRWRANFKWEKRWKMLFRTFQLLVANFDLTRVEATQKVNQRGQTCPGCSRRSKGENI